MRSPCRAGVFLVALAVAQTVGASPYGNSVLVRATYNPCAPAGGPDGSEDAVLSPDGEYLYVAGGYIAGVHSGSLSVWKLDAGRNGFHQVQVIDSIPALDGGQRKPAANFLAMDPDGARVYVSLARASGARPAALLTFDRDPVNGTLALVDRDEAPSGHFDSAGVVVSPDGSNVYVVGGDLQGGTGPILATVVAFSADSGGVTYAATYAQDPAGGISFNERQGLAISADGHDVYVGSLVHFIRDPTDGTLTLGAAIAGGLDEGKVVLSPDGIHAYATRTDKIYSRDVGTGALSIVGTTLWVFYEVAISTDGLRVYAGRSGGLNSYRRDPATGALTLLGSGFPTVSSRPHMLALAPEGDRLYSGINSVVTLNVDVTTGALATTQYLTKGNPRPKATTFTADGRHGYVLCSSGSDGQVAFVERDPLTGALSTSQLLSQGIAGVDGLVQPAELALSPDERHLYVDAQSFTGCVVSLFARDLATGSLTYQASYDVGACRDSLGVSRDGLTVYSSRYASTRDPTTGALTFREDLNTIGLDHALDWGAEMTFSSDGHFVYMNAGAELVVASYDGPGQAHGLVQRVPLSGYHGNASVTLSPDERFVYAGDDWSVVGFARDPATGALTSIVDRKATIFEPVMLATSSDGRALYASTYSLRFGVYRRDVATGRFWEVEDVPPPPDANVVSDVALVPDDAWLYATHWAGVAAYERLRPCDPTPRVGCRGTTSPGGSTMKMKLNSDGRRNKLLWKLRGGDAASVGDLGDPTTTDGYAVCAYDASSQAQPALAATIRPAGTCRKNACWKPTALGFKMSAPEAVPDGVRKLVVATGPQSSVNIKAKGASLPAPDAVLELPVRLQLQLANGECWEAVFSTALRNDERGMQATSD